MTATDLAEVDLSKVDFSKVEALAGQLVGFMAGGAICAGVILGDELGLYRVMADGQSRSADDIAAAAGCHPRLTRE